jgi:hypothetical protein
MTAEQKEWATFNTLQSMNNRLKVLEKKSWFNRICVEHGRITKEMAEDLLDISLRIAGADARKLYPGFETFSEARQAALTDFVYQLGYTRASRFTNMRRAINPDWDEAAEQVRDSLYWRQLGGDPVGTDDGKTERPEVIYKMLKEG